MDLSPILSQYDTNNLTVGTLGGHSGLDVCHGAKKMGLRTVCVAREGREKTYEKYYRTRSGYTSSADRGVMLSGTRSEAEGVDEVSLRSFAQCDTSIGCVDECITVPQFDQILNDDVQETLRDLNTIFIQNRYFWVYFNDYSAVENDFKVPFFGNRSYVKIEERDQEYTQYDLLRDAGIRIPKMYSDPKEIDRPVLVKANEKDRGYERAFFIAASADEYEQIGSQMEAEGKVDESWRSATIEEFIVGAPVNFNFFYSPLSGELELMGTDTRRQTNLDGFLRMTAEEQMKAMKNVPLKMIETGHYAVTIKESLVEKAFDLGEKFVTATKKMDSTGIIGPFALQGAVIAEEGREDIVIFDVSLRIPGSPGTKFTPYSMYLHGEPMSYGERIALEIKRGAQEGRLAEILT